MVVAAFNQEKALVGALVGAFSVIVQLHRLIVYSTRMLYLISHSPITISTNTLHTSQSAGGDTDTCRLYIYNTTNMDGRMQSEPMAGLTGSQKFV